MSNISEKIKATFPDQAILKDRANDSLFKGRNLPSFVKDYLLRRFSQADGTVDRAAVTAYLEEKMPSKDSVKNRLIRGEEVNITTSLIVKGDVPKQRFEFQIPDTDIISSAVISSSVVEKHGKELTDGQKWANITMRHIKPAGRETGEITMTEFKSFEPYRHIDLAYYRDARQSYTTEEWIDMLIAAMEYAPDAFDTLEQKLEFISRLLPLVEPRLNMIELGPKGTGKSYIYNNLSKHVWLISGGTTSRAQLFYNIATKQYGAIKDHDLVVIDEVQTFTFSSPQQVESIFKGYLEDGKAKFGNSLQMESECGILLSGNIPLTSDKQPIDGDYFKSLPVLFHSSAVLDRFHGFVEGWLLPRLTTGGIMQGWTLDTEYFSAVLHLLRTEPDYEMLFNELVETDEEQDLRDRKAVCKIATAYCKLLFPHVTSLKALDADSLAAFRELYLEYCLKPAVYRRGIIRTQCHLIDPEYKPDMPEFKLKSPLSPTPENPDSPESPETPESPEAPLPDAPVQ